MHNTMIVYCVLLWKTICRDLSDNDLNASNIPSWVTTLPGLTTVYVVPSFLHYMSLIEKKKKVIHFN